MEPMTLLPALGSGKSHRSERNVNGVRSFWAKGRRGRGSGGPRSPAGFPATLRPVESVAKRPRSAPVTSV